MEDKVIYTRQLQGEGRWYYAIGYVDADGNIYEVWQDQDGDEKIVENV